MLKSDGYLERGDAPAQAVLRANAEQQAIRQAIETQEELHKIRERVCITLSAYEVGEELQAQNQNNVEDVKNAFVKDDTELEFVNDMASLYLILSDPIAKRKYQQKVTIFVVGYENLCSHRNKLLLQLQEFFTQSTAKDDAFALTAPEFDFDEVEKNVRDALSKAEKTTERLAKISKDVLKIFEMVNPKDSKKGKKKLEKALFQSQQDVMHLTEKLVGVQSDFEDAKTKLTTLDKQLELKDSDIQRLKIQVNSSKVFEKECIELKKGLQAKEQQLQTYRTQMDEVELSLSQAESKYDEYVEMCRTLKEENQHLKNDIEARSDKQELKFSEMKKDLETRYNNEVNELKTNQEQEIARLKENYEDELLSLKEKLDMMRRQSLTTAGTSVLPESRDSARFTSTDSEYASRAMSIWKSSAKSVTTIVESKDSEGSRLNTASSEALEPMEKDSVLERSSSIFVSMSNTPVPRTPKTAESLRPNVIRQSRDTSPVRETTESFTQTDDVNEEASEEREVKSRNDLLEIERDMARTPTNELPQKLDEYKSKFAEIEQQLQEEVLQWKLRFNTKAQTLNELVLTQEEQTKEKEELMEQLSVAQQQKTAAEQEAEKAILQLEELRAEKEGGVQMEDDATSIDVIQTQSRGTATSASLYRMQTLQPSNDESTESVGIQCPSGQASRKPSARSPQYSDTVDEQEMLLFGGLYATDSGFGGSGNVLHPDDGQHDHDQSKISVQARSPSSVASSGRVRSRLVRSALRDHRVVVETLRTYEMITEFKMNIVLWLQEHGLEDKSQLLIAIPDLTLNKEDELDVLSKMSAIRDTTGQILNALWQVTKDDYSWPQDDVTAGAGADKNDEDNVVHTRDIGIEVDTTRDDALLSSPSSNEKLTGKPEEQIFQDVLATRPVETARRHIARPTPTTPKGYTRLLHEYNNLSEEYNTLTQQLQENVKSYQDQISENAAFMNEMQETINHLRSQLMDGATSGKVSTQPSVSSLMFTRLDAERNVKSMKRAVLTKRLSQDSYDTIIQEMNEYVNLPSRRLAELVKRYRHHCIMKDVEETLNPVRMTSAEVYKLQERMEQLQRTRALKWSEKMAELSRERFQLGDKITSSLKGIEESSGIFLIKPVYSYKSRSSEVEKSSHPVVCKKRLKGPAQSPERQKKPTYPLETTRTPVWNCSQSVERPMWISNDSHVSNSGTAFDDNPIPRLLAMDVNRFTLRKNLVSGSIDMKVGNGGSGVRQYVTIERPIGCSKPLQADRANDVPSSSRHSSPVASRASLPGSFTPYDPLPPINLSESSPAAVTNQSASFISLTSFDENFAR